MSNNKFISSIKNAVIDPKKLRKHRDSLDLDGYFFQSEILLPGDWIRRKRNPIRSNMLNDPELQEQVKEMLIKGISQKEIADELAMHPSQVSVMRKRFFPDLKPPEKTCVNCGKKYIPDSWQGNRRFCERACNDQYKQKRNKK